MKIEKFFDKKELKEKYRTRFQLNNKEFRPVADSRKKLNEMIDEIRAQEHRAKFDLPVTRHSPTVKELFDKHRPRIKNEKQKTLFKRVSEKFLSLIPEELKVTELKKAHFQKYIDERLTEKNPQQQFILPETVNKELSAVSVALKAAPTLFPELEEFVPPQMPKAKQTNRRRERLVHVENELAVLLAELRRPHKNPFVEERRKDLADDLEIRYQTGLRRKEVASLKKVQYFRDQQSLRNVKRWKTDTETPFFPLSARAVEIIETRLGQIPDREYIFTRDGKPMQSSYRLLKKVCGKLGIKYGSFTEGGFVPHDLRHNFATEIIRVTDIETAKSLTGHTGQHILTYLHTDERLQREAIQNREGIDLTEALTALYNNVKNGNMDVRTFIEKVQSLTKIR